MFELLCSPNTSGFISTSSLSLLFLSNSNLSVSCRQACAVGLRNASYWSGLTLPFMFKLPDSAPCCWRHLHDGMIGFCSP
jgi:hypothetical protein